MAKKEKAEAEEDAKLLGKLLKRKRRLPEKSSET